MRLFNTFFGAGRSRGQSERFLEVEGQIRLDVNLRSLRGLEEENRRLNVMCAELGLEHRILKEMVEKDHDDQLTA